MLCGLGLEFWLVVVLARFLCCNCGLWFWWSGCVAPFVVVLRFCLVTLLWFGIVVVVWWFIVAQAGFACLWARVVVYGGFGGVFWCFWW